MSARLSLTDAEAKPKLRVLSLGAGVQSTTMALMVAHGEIPPVDCAIFADTGWEPKAVYEHLNWLRSGNVLPFPVHIVTAGNIRDDIVSKNSKRSGRFASVPFFIKGADGNAALGRRQCTAHYKIEPLRREYRRILGYEPRQRIPVGSVEVLIGISTDEASRMKDSRDRWIVNNYPLIDLRMSRGDCLEWLKRHGYPQPPKSACIGCPFRSNAEWRRLTPDEFHDATQVDAAIRQGRRGQQFMHRSLKPLDQVDMSTAEERGQINMFENECEGMCGV